MTRPLLPFAALHVRRPRIGCGDHGFASSFPITFSITLALELESPCIGEFDAKGFVVESLSQRCTSRPLATGTRVHQHGEPLKPWPAGLATRGRGRGGAAGAVRME